MKYVQMHRNCIQAIHFITGRCIEDPACSTGQCQHRTSSCFHIEQMQFTKHSSTLFRKVGSTVQLSFRVMYKNSSFVCFLNTAIETQAVRCVYHISSITQTIPLLEGIHSLDRSKLPITNGFQNVWLLYRRSTTFEGFAKQILSYCNYS